MHPDQLGCFRFPEIGNLSHANSSHPTTGIVLSYTNKMTNTSFNNMTQFESGGTAASSKLSLFHLCGLHSQDLCVSNTDPAAPGQCPSRLKFKAKYPFSYGTKLTA